MSDAIQTEAQAIINHLVGARSAALDQIAQMVGVLAVRDARIKELEAKVEELTPKRAKKK